jgi:3-hydroxybutyryl-CoA dehydrogenase
LDIDDYLTRALGPRFEPPDLLRNKLAQGGLRRKAGQGSYHWDD